MYIERYCRMLRYWFKFLYTDNCILKCLYEDMFESSVVKSNDILNLACKVKDILFKYGFHNFWISQYVNHVDFFICEVKQRMNDNFISEMNTLLMSLLIVIYTDICLTIMFYNFILIVHLIIFISHIFVKCVYQHIILILKLENSII
jgi:hypothetical protein